MNVTDPILRVSVVSTGQVTREGEHPFQAQARVHGRHCCRPLLSPDGRIAGSVGTVNLYLAPQVLHVHIADPLISSRGAAAKPQHEAA